jgi:hypothetical protein
MAYEAQKQNYITYHEVIKKLYCHERQWNEQFYYETEPENMSVVVYVIKKLWKIKYFPSYC